MTVTLRRLLLSRLSLWIALTAASGYFLLFHVFNVFTPQEERATKTKYINWGIDLAGGSLITLNVQLNEAREHALVDYMQEAMEQIAEKQKIKTVKNDIKDEIITLTFANLQDAYAASEFLTSLQQMRGLTIATAENMVTMRLTPKEIQRVEKDAVESIKSILAARLNDMGLSEVSVVAYGEKRIMVELPDVHDLREARARIGATALLEIKPVEDHGASEAEILQRYGGRLPESMMLVPGEDRSGSAFYMVPKYTTVTGRQLRSVSAGRGGKTGVDPVVHFQFNASGARHFAEMTEKNIGRQLAVIVDGKVRSAPVVNCRIAEAGTIEGSFTPQEAKRLAMLMKSGAYVARVTFEAEQQVGSSLGSQEAYQGLIACLIGLTLLLGFCVFVYKVAGMLAFLVLVYNLMLSLLIFATLRATLTLPGIASLILTVGIAVDASILIFERIREELAHGAPLRKAVDTGFAGALPVILDSNITSFLIAIVLYWFGSGAIRGFAAAQIIGIVSTFITGLWLLRSFFTFATDVLGVKKIRF